MAILTCVSGLDGKLPAAFLLELNGKRILLDLGEGPEPGVRPDVDQLGDIDAIFLSHAHIDHIGSMDIWESLGSPPVFASAATFRGLRAQGISLPESCRHILPLGGAVSILGLPFTVGRSGHAIGGLWLHSASNDGFLYMGDWSREGTILAFDVPPHARTVITDMSYCDRVQTLSEQIALLAQNAPDGALLPVPPLGRGTELALRLTQAGRSVAVCDVIAAEIEVLSTDVEGFVPNETRSALLELIPTLGRAMCADEKSLIVVVDADHQESVLPALMTKSPRHVILTGHVAENTIGERLLQQKQASRMPWNVHPSRGCNIWLADILRAERILPAFGKIADAPHLAAAFGDRLSLKSPLVL